jgi:hypothetical protein
MLFKLIKQGCKQVIRVKHRHSILTINHAIKLSMWWPPQISGYSYPRVAAIRIDENPVGENPTNTPHAFHAQSAYDPIPHVSHVVHIYQPFAQSSTDLNGSTALEKKGSRHNPQHAGWPIHESVPSFSPITANEAVGKSSTSVGIRLLGLSDPYH